MKATLLYPNGNYKEFTARNAKSLVKKLNDIGVSVDQFDIIIFLMSAGFREIGKGYKLSVKSK